jgi:hypothetical protein
MAQVFFSSLGQPAQLHDGNNPLGTPRNPLVVRSGGKPTFTLVAEDIAPANNKYMWTLWNANTTYDIVIQEIRALHSNIGAVTGVLLKQSLLRLAALTSGTPLTTIFADDPETDTLPASMTADTGSTSVTDGAVLDPAIFVTAEEVILAATAMQLNRMIREGQIVYRREDGQRGITLSGTTAANRGLGMKNLTSDTAGSLSYIIKFTVEKTNGDPS